MRFQYLACLLLATLAYGQAAPQSAPPAATTAGTPQSAAAPADKAPEVQVGPDDVVLTLKGYCTDTALQGEACKTTITRAEFDKLAEALQPGMSPAIRRQLATTYSRGLKMAAAAEKRGLDKQPKFEEKMKFARIQVLSGEMSTALQQDSANVSDADIKDYYDKNVQSYEQATFARIFVPHSKQITSTAAKPKAAGTGSAKGGAKTAAPEPPTAEQIKAGDEAMKKEADLLRTRAVNGEDPDKLQKAAYVAAGLPANPPNTKMERVRRTTLPANHHAAMDLKPGEVSEVLVDANSGYYIYKMISKETLTLETVKPEISKSLSGQRYRESMQSFQGDVDLNEAYFGPNRNPGMPMPARGPKKPAPAVEDPD
jgi:bifunctional DNA-binding transcriptional regulator/antitoxin component of YhaV-PrlF toxin-antitoxin module